MSLEMKAARARAGSPEQGLAWGTVLSGLGSAAGWLGGFLGGRKPQPGQTTSTSQVTRTPGLSGLAQRVFPGGKTGYQVTSLGRPAAAASMATPIAEGTTIACPSGYQPNKSDYFLKDGTFIAKGTKCVKRRRRNSLNPRAASRAAARLTGAKKAMRALDHIKIQCKKCGKTSCPGRC